MLNIGPMEWLVIGVAIIIFIKPEDLPKLIRHIGKAYGSLSRMMNEINATIADLDQEVRKPMVKIDPFSICQSPLSTSVKKETTSSEVRDDRPGYPQALQF